MIILHGDHIVDSRLALNLAKEQGQSKGLNLVEFIGSSLTLSQLNQAAFTNSLLGETSLIVITDFFSRRVGKDKTAIIDFLKQHTDLSIILWDGKDVTTALTGFAPGLIRKFDLPKYVFKYLDTLLLPLLQQTLANTAPEQVFALLVRRMRDLLLAKYQVLTGPEWKTRQLLSQSSRYSILQLQELYLQLLTIDYQQKTSGSAMDLKAALELWTVSAVI